MLFAPLEGWRRVEVIERRTRVDWTHPGPGSAGRGLSGQAVVLVMDNLNTHSPGSLYEAFEPAEARRLAKRLEIHYTPKHGSWLNMAEIEIGAMVGQCLDRRIPDRGTIRREVGAWHGAGTASPCAWIGVSPRRMPGSSSSPSIHQYKCDGVLVPSTTPHAFLIKELVACISGRIPQSIECRLQSAVMVCRRAVVLQETLGQVYEFFG